ncbi:tyrosine-type recombinase/integrase [Candidatus Saccharibacteria bacterium]|nr:tyrosine-type recombinase/integrase [Candidatus Saccharibacteria bacterium]
MTIEKEMGDYLLYCEKVRRMTEVTLTAKRSILERFVRMTGLESLSALTNEVFDEWMEYELGRGVCGASVNIYNSVIFAMVRYYREMGMRIPLNIALIGKLKEGKTERKFYTAADIAKVVALADEETGLMIRIMFETGMRIAELTRLRVDNFEPGFCGRKVRFVGKGRKPREVYLHAETVAAVRDFVQKYGIREYLWGVYEAAVTLNGEPPVAHTVRLRLRRAFLQAGFEGFYPHALRHSFATNLQMKGATVSEIKEMIGHSSVATTERYLHGFDGRLKELFDKYS